MSEGMDIPDEQLIARARDGDVDAFNTLVDRYQNSLFNLCIRLTGDRQAAEDATQEAFLSAWRSLGRFSGGNVRSWLLRIAANECKDELRRRRRKDVASSLDQVFDTQERVLEVSDHSEGAPDFVERAELAGYLQEALLNLPFDQRQAIVLVDVYEFRYEEVATMTGTSTGTVKSRIHRGRERLRTYIQARPELFGDPRRLTSHEGRG
jgi:RNA polymerase sigma-70 factor (ECF subfamily)